MDLERIYKEVSKQIKAMSKADVDNLNEELRNSNKKPYILDDGFNEYYETHLSGEGFYLDLNITDNGEHIRKDDNKNQKYNKKLNKISNNNNAFAA